MIDIPWGLHQALNATYECLHGSDKKQRLKAPGGVPIGHYQVMYLNTSHHFLNRLRPFTFEVNHRNGEPCFYQCSSSTHRTNINTQTPQEMHTYLNRRLCSVRGPREL